MPGYLNRVDLTTQVMHDGWYHSRDVMRRDENGFYFFISRSDDMFTCGGENIYPIEVEQVLEKHPEVEQAIVVAVPDEVKQSLPFAFVVRTQGSSLSEGALKTWFIERAPAFMHPRGVSFLSEAPLGQTNKIDRASLSARARDLLNRDAR
jgi:acyl-CoA synthetase (AMP-forming)/AMP-acid ligase II